jgi:hypothetical protein
MTCAPAPGRLHLTPLPSALIPERQYRTSCRDSPIPMGSAVRLSARYNDMKDLQRKSCDRSGSSHPTVWRCQVEPGFIHKGIYRHVANSNVEELFLHNLEYSLLVSRQCVDDGEFRRQVACTVMQI